MTGLWGPPTFVPPRRPSPTRLASRSVSWFVMSHAMVQPGSSTTRPANTEPSFTPSCHSFSDYILIIVFVVAVPQPKSSISRASIPRDRPRAQGRVGHYFAMYRPPSLPQLAVCPARPQRWSAEVCRTSDSRSLWQGLGWSEASPERPLVVCGGDECTKRAGDRGRWR